MAANRRSSTGWHRGGLQGGPVVAHQRLATNIWDIATKAVPLCSVYTAPSYKPNFSVLAPLSTKFVYLNILFILDLTSMKPIQE